MSTNKTLRDAVAAIYRAAYVNAAPFVPEYALDFMARNDTRAEFDAQLIADLFAAYAAECGGVDAVRRHAEATLHAAEATAPEVP